MAKIDQNDKGLAFTFGLFWLFFQLVQNRSKRPKMTSGVVENDSKVFSLCFWRVFKKFKKWPRLTKMVRGKPLLFGPFLPFFQLVQNRSKRLKMTSGVAKNDWKVFSLCFWSVFKKFKKWPKLTKMVRGKPLLFGPFFPFFQLLQNGSKRPKMTSGVVENHSKVFSLCFSSVFKKLKKWPKLTKMVRGKPLLFGHFLPFFQLLQNGSKSSKMTSGVVENDSKVFSLCFWSVFKKLKKWPKLTKMVRGKPLLFGPFLTFFQLLQNGSKRPKMTSGVVENHSKVFSLCFWSVFKKFKKWPKLTKMVRGKPLLFGPYLPFFQLLQNGSKRPKMTSGVVENHSKVFSLCFSSAFNKMKKWPKLTKMVRG